jgi:hypothetical protein
VEDATIVELAEKEVLAGLYMSISMRYFPGVVLVSVALDVAVQVVPLVQAGPGTAHAYFPLSGSPCAIMAR